MRFTESGTTICAQRKTFSSRLWCRKSGTNVTPNGLWPWIGAPAFMKISHDGPTYWTPMSRTKKQTNYGGQMYFSIIEILYRAHWPKKEKMKCGDRRNCGETKQSAKKIECNAFAYLQNNSAQSRTELTRMTFSNIFSLSTSTY